MNLAVRQQWSVVCLLWLVALSAKALSQEKSKPDELLQNAKALLAKGDSKAADALLQTITARPLNDEERSFAQQAWNLRGQIAERSGLLSDALAYHSTSIDILGKSREQAQLPLAPSLCRRANVLRQLGQFESATSDCVQAMALIEGAFPPGQEKEQRLAMAACFNVFGAIERSRGDFDAAQARYESALKIFEHDLPPNHPNTAAVLSNLGINFQKKGDFGSARRRLEQALGMLDPARVDQREMVAAFSHNLGGTLESQGELAAAKEKYLESLELLQSIHGTKPNALTATVWASLGMLELELNRPQSSVDYLEQALAARELLFEGSSANPHIALANQNLAKALLELGDIETAREKALSTIKAQQEIYGDETTHPDLCKSYLLLARIFAKKKDLDSAIAQAKLAVESYFEAYPKLSYPDGHGDVAEALEVLGVYQLRGGQTSDAIDSLLQAEQMRVALAQNFVLSAAEAESREYLSVRLPTPKPMLEAMRIEGWAADKQYAAILSSRRMVQRTIANRNRWIHEHLNDAERVARYWAVRRLLNFASGIQELDQQNRAAILIELRKLTEEKESLERQLADVIELTDEKQHETSFSRLNEALTHNAALIEILEIGDSDSDGSQRQYIGFVVFEGTVARVDFGDANVVEQTCSRWLQAIASPSDHAAERRLAMTVSDQIWKPIAASLPANIDRLYFCPDGIFAQIPWIALFDNDQNTRVVQRFTVSLLPYSQLLYEPPADLLLLGTQALLVGDVDYGLSNWPSLPGTGDELTSLTSIFGKLSRIHTDTLRGRDATVENVCRLLPAATLVHFATHGQFVGSDSKGLLNSGSADRNPLLSSGLILAPSEPNSKSQAIVTGEQIAAVDLRNLQLATLSACDSGRGRLLYGDGVYGLQQAFHLAGAQAVVASRWRIDDRQTVVLMNSFYEHMLHQQLDPARALAAAQRMFRADSLIADSANRGASEVDAPRKQLQAGSQQGVHPFYWASFQHSGR